MTSFHWFPADISGKPDVIMTGTREESPRFMINVTGVVGDPQNAADSPAPAAATSAPASLAGPMQAGSAGHTVAGRYRRHFAGHACCPLCWGRPRRVAPRVHGGGSRLGPHRLAA